MFDILLLTSKYTDYLFTQLLYVRIASKWVLFKKK